MDLETEYTMKWMYFGVVVGWYFFFALMMYLALKYISYAHLVEPVGESICLTHSFVVTHTTQAVTM